MLKYTLTIFLSSFLLFQVQPLIGKYILPWYGGAAAVWTTCLLFFQVALLAGYSYAHVVVSWLRPRRQAQLHMALLGASLLLLPIVPGEDWKSVSEGDPTWRILALLAVTVGGPYLMLATTAPLIQSWFHRTESGKSPFRLYALSNVAALLALFTFPFVFEPLLPLATQTILWSIAYVAFAAASAFCAWRVMKLTDPPVLVESIGSMADDRATKSVAPEVSVRPPSVDVALWLGLAACGSVLLLAITNHLCQDVAAIPFLWVLPLGLYLLTFVICFDHERWYSRKGFSLALVAGVILASAARSKPDLFSMPAQIGIHCFTLFACCMVCHGELVHLKPHPRYLTLFYLLISAGGALGGIFVALVAPVIFDSYMEYPIGLVCCCLLRLAARRRSSARTQNAQAHRFQIVKIAAAGVVVLVVILSLRALLSAYASGGRQELVVVQRNFFGALRVTLDDATRPEICRQRLSHGTTVHGFQFQAEDKRGKPTMYYVEKSGVGIAVEHHPRRAENLRIGVVGLGVGTIAAYARSGDYLRFYEINPAVIALAQSHFTFQQDAKDRGADVNVWLGDARIVMEQQLADGRPQQFDVLAVDAFSSDSIPVHLLTSECFDIYRRHLKPDGVLAVHISNLYLDLSPVLRSLANRTGQQSLGIYYRPKQQRQEGAEVRLPSDWILITTNERFLGDQSVIAAAKPWPINSFRPIVWTDDFSNLFGLVRW